MQRFGFNTLVVVLGIFIGTGTSFAEDSYDEDDMARLSTLVRITMSIVKGEYYGETVPSEISENEIVHIVRTQNSPHFKELEQLEGTIELVIVSNGTEVAAVVWDSDSNRKLIQDLQCTPAPDDRAYQRVEFGSEFTLGWEACLVH